MPKTYHYSKLQVEPIEMLSPSLDLVETLHLQQQIQAIIDEITAFTITGKRKQKLDVVAVRVSARKNHHGQWEYSDSGSDPWYMLDASDVFSAVQLGKHTFELTLLRSSATALNFEIIDDAIPSST